MGGDILKAMIHLLAVVFTVSGAWAQTPNRFENYCAQINAPTMPEYARPNTKVVNLMAVVNATNNLDKLMKDSVVAGYDYQEFKSRMAARKIVLNDQFHADAYARTARLKCEALASTEAGVGGVGIQAHNSPTDEQLGRRVDDSGIGVSQPSSGGDSGGGSETDR